jgi:flavin reductase (DIM6/NTAB) family NADH-FMN oxidoreductase RutF
MVTEELVEQMNKTAQTIPSHESEFEFANLTPIASSKVKAPRVKESPIAMECELVHHYTLENSKFGGSTILVGRIVLFHIDEQMMLEDFKINQENYQPISRLAGSNYAKIGEIFAVKRN